MTNIVVLGRCGSSLPQYIINSGQRLSFRRVFTSLIDNRFKKRDNSFQCISTRNTRCI